MTASEPKETIFTFTFLALSLINLFVMAAYYLLFVISSPYAVANFNASPSMAGLVAGVMVLGCLAARFVCGWLVEVIGLKKVLFSGLVIYIVGIGLYLVAHSMPLLLIFRFISGIGVGSIGTVTGTLVAHIVPARKRGQGVSYFTLSTILALAAGPFLGIFLMQFLSFTALFLLCLALGAVSFIMAFFLRFPEWTPAAPSHGHGVGLGDFLEFRVVPVCLVILLAGLCYGNVQAFLASHARDHGLESMASFYFLAYAATVFISRLFTGKIMDIRGENSVAYPALVLMLLSLLLLTKANSVWMLLLSGALLGMGFGNFQSLGQIVCIKLVPRQRFGQATSTFYIFLDLGVGLGPYALGLLVPRFGYDGLYMAASALAFVTIPAYYLLHGRKEYRAPE